MWVYLNGAAETRQWESEAPYERWMWPWLLRWALESRIQGILGKEPMAETEFQEEAQGKSLQRTSSGCSQKGLGGAKRR